MTELATRPTFDLGGYCSLCDEELFECTVTGCQCPHEATEIEPGAFASWRAVDSPLSLVIEELRRGD